MYYRLRLVLLIKQQVYSILASGPHLGGWTSRVYPWV